MAFTYNTLSSTLFIVLINPGALANIQVGLLGPQITVIETIHIREAVIYKIYTSTDKSLKQLLLGVVNEIFTHALRNMFIVYTNVNKIELITHLYATSGNTSVTDLRNNDVKMNTA